MSVLSIQGYLCASESGMPSVCNNQVAQGKKRPRRNIPSRGALALARNEIAAWEYNINYTNRIACDRQHLGNTHCDSNMTGTFVVIPVLRKTQLTV